MAQAIKRFLFSAPMRTIAATLVLVAIVVPVNKLVLKPILAFLPLEEDSLASIRFIFMLPFTVWTYIRIFGWIENRRVTEGGLEHFWREISLGFIGGFVAIGFTLLILLVLGEFSVLGFYSKASVIAIIKGFIILAMLSLTEELLYRGVLYRAVQNSLGTFIALAATGLIFGVVELQQKSGQNEKSCCIIL